MGGFRGDLATGGAIVKEATYDVRLAYTVAHMDTGGPRPRQRRAKLLAMIATALLMAAGAASASAASSIEGIWAFGGGEIAIRPGPHATFVGTVVAETKFAECVHPVGQEIWKEMRLQSDGSYWGLHQWYFEKTCVINEDLGPTAWRVMEEPNGSRYLRVCLSEPGGPQPTIAINGADADATYGCLSSTLVAPLPKVGVSGFLQSLLHPGAKKCVSARRFIIHLAEPTDDPFKTLRITLRGRKLATVRRGSYLVATVNLKGLPLGAFTIKISARTVLGLHLSGSRTYHTCAKRPTQHKPGRLKPSRMAKS